MLQEDISTGLLSARSKTSVLGPAIRTSLLNTSTTTYVDLSQEPSD